MSVPANHCVPQTGHATPQYDDAGIARAEAALLAFGSIHVPYGPQQAIAGRIELLRRRCLGKRGVPLPGLRLSQVSQAGKSKVLQEYKCQLEAATLLATGKVNPYQILYLGLEVRITVKMMCGQLLRMMGDPHAEKGNTDEVKLRTQEFMRVRGVELLIVDEVQHLARDSHDKVDVTDELKRFLDTGIVPVVMAGNEDSRRFFERNPQLASRLGTPLELSPVNLREVSELSAFKQFCADLDDALVVTGAVRQRSGFGDRDHLNGLLTASGGHIGRVCRIVEAALEQAALRDADFVELFDLSNAVDNFAVPQRYTRLNPFTLQS